VISAFEYSIPFIFHSKPTSNVKSAPSLVMLPIAVIPLVNEYIPSRASVKLNFSVCKDVSL
jgi:hypothetical protein